MMLMVCVGREDLEETGGVAWTDSGGGAKMAEESP